MSAAHGQVAGSASARPWWPWLKRGFTVAFFGLVIYLLVSHARELDWAQVWESLRRRPLSSLLPALLVAALSYAVYSCYDLLSRRYAGHDLPTPQVLTTTFISYAFNLNLGSWVGGLGFRHRLYSRLGLDNGEISRIIGFSMLTNWIGYLLLAGIAFMLRPLQIPDDWVLGSGALQALGAILAGMAIGYVLLCAFSRKREWQVRGHELKLPTARMAGLQVLISATNWMLIALIIYLLLQREVPYPTALAVLLIAAVAGVVAHIPAGLGVLEGVFVALLAGTVPTHELLASLLAYRAIYYLAPLMLATALYLFMETKIGKESP